MYMSLCLGRVPCLTKLEVTASHRKLSTVSTGKAPSRAETAHAMGALALDAVLLPWGAHLLRPARSPARKIVRPLARQPSSCNCNKTATVNETTPGGHAAPTKFVLLVSKGACRKICGALLCL